MKTKTRYFLFFIGFISIIMIGKILLPPHWLYIYYGTFAFVFGSIALTEEWKTGKRISAIVFIIAIAVGGLLTTKGWNELEYYSQKKALIVSLAREWILNEAYYTLMMSLDVNDPNFGKQHLMYPQFRTFAQNNILTSPLFDLRNTKDKKLILATIDYEEAIKYFNMLLSWENEDCFHFPENAKQQGRKNIYFTIREYTPLRIHFKEYHSELYKLLQNEYNWALDEAKQTNIINISLMNLPLSGIKE